MSNVNNPMVSIIIPVYNGSNYLEFAINCALEQDYENIEVIVVNDGSCDDGKTEQVALSFGDKIRYFRKENGGVSSALNYGIRVMRGEYFSWLSHDDGYSASKVSDAICMLKNASMIDKKCVAFTGGYFINGKNEIIKDFANPFKKNTVYFGAEVVNMMTRTSTLNGCCFLIPRRVFDDVAMFEENLRYSQDSLMWYRMFLCGYSLISDNKKNVINRVHPEQVTSTRRDLYEHDAVIISKELAPALLESDSTGTVLYNYIKRHARQNCKTSISYLRQYAANSKALPLVKTVALDFYIFFGKIRYYAVGYAKKVLLR